jgi:hypothetical protein
MNLRLASEYLTVFFRSRYQPYLEIMQDTGSANHPPAYQGEDDVIESIRNTVPYVTDEYWNLSIPEVYASPKLLLDSLMWLRTLADKQLQEVEDLQKRLSKPDDIYINYKINYAYKINLEVREAIDHALSLSRDTMTAQIPPIERLRQIAERLPSVAHQLTIRRSKDGKSRSTLEINDEYDVQDLLHAILKLDFDDIRPEEWCPSYAGSSMRSDFLLKNEAIFVEVKKTRPKLGSKEISEQLIIDIAHYRNHPNCQHLFCLIWDSEKVIQNPVALKRDLEDSNTGFVSVAITG